MTRAIWLDLHFLFWTESPWTVRQLDSRNSLNWDALQLAGVMAGLTTQQLKLFFQAWVWNRNGKKRRKSKRKDDRRVLCVKTSTERLYLWHIFWSLLCGFELRQQNRGRRPYGVVNWIVRKTCLPLPPCQYGRFTVRLRVSAGGSKERAGVLSFRRSIPCRVRRLRRHTPERRFLWWFLDRRLNSQKCVATVRGGFIGSLWRCQRLFAVMCLRLLNHQEKQRPTGVQRERRKSRHFSGWKMDSSSFCVVCQHETQTCLLTEHWNSNAMSPFACQFPLNYG